MCAFRWQIKKKKINILGEKKEQRNLQKATNLHEKKAETKKQRLRESQMSLFWTYWKTVINPDLKRNKTETVR